MCSPNNGYTDAEYKTTGIIYTKILLSEFPVKTIADLGKDYKWKPRVFAPVYSLVLIVWL